MLADNAPVHAHDNAFTGAGCPCKDLKRNGQDRAITPRPLTHRFLSAPVHAQIKKGQPPKLRLTKIDGVSAIDRADCQKVHTNPVDDDRTWTFQQLAFFNGRDLTFDLTLN